MVVLRPRAMGQAKLKDEAPAMQATDTVSDDAQAESPFERPKALTPKALAVLAVIAAVINLPLIHYYLLRAPAEATVTLPYRDDFADPKTVQNNYFSIGGHWRTVDGWLLSPGVKNNPAWLKAKLPADVAVEFDARSTSPEGDIKCEIFGDGVDHASGYVLIHGGWGNQISVIARRDEHGVAFPALQQQAREANANPDDMVASGFYKEDTRVRVEANPFPVTIGKTEHWRIERRGATISWSIDGQPFMQFTDPLPLKGVGHDRFGFSSWEAQLYFDNLSIQPL